MSEAAIVDNEGVQNDVMAGLADMAQELAQEREQPRSAAEAEAAGAAEAEEAAGYQMGAQMAVGFVAQMVAMSWPAAVVPAEGQAAIAEKLAPVMRKHGGGLPEWLLPYQEELALAAAVAGVAFGVVMQVKAQRKAEQLQKEQEAKKEAATPSVSDVPVSFAGANTAGGVDEFGRPLVAA